MSRPASCLAVGVLTLCVWMAACDRPAPVAPPALRRALRTTSPHVQGPARNWRDELHDESQRNPGFTGVFIDSDGVVTVAGTSALGESGREHALTWAAIRGLGPTTPSRFREVGFDYASLYDAYNAIMNVIGRSPALTRGYIDETSGLIHLGVEDSTALKDFRNQLGDIPAGMVRFEVSRRANVESGLQDTIRPVLPGTQIADNVYGEPCTLGFTAWGRDSTGYYPDMSVGYGFTASHCTYPRGLVNAFEVFGQPSVTKRIGEDWDDTPFYTSGSGCSHTICQDADVAVIRIDDSLVTTMSWQYAAKSSAVSSGNPPYLGSQAIGSTVFGGYFVGSTVRKVGRTTGETVGTIVQPCVDQPPNDPLAPTGLWVICSVEATYASDHGDSGAPVWAPGSPPRILGIHWGRDPTTTHVYFSRWDIINIIFPNYYY